MKLFCVLAVLLAQLTAMANPDSRWSGPDAMDAFPSEGVLNPEAGTIEITATPCRDTAEFLNDWFFAVQLQRQKSDHTGSRSVLGLYTPSGEFNDSGLFLIARTAQKQTWRVADTQPGLVAGKTVNLAISWGPDGLCLYADGHLRQKSKFSGRIAPMAPLLEICRGYPWYVSRFKVSDAQLPANRLNPDVNRPYSRDPSTTLLRNGNTAEPQFFIGKNLAAKGFFSLRPDGTLAEKIFVACKPLRLELTGCNFSAAPHRFPVKLTIADAAGGPPREVSSTVTLPAATCRQLSKLELPALAPGYYRLSIAIADQRYEDAVSVLPPPSPAADGPLAQYLGFSLPEDPVVLEKIGVHWARAWETRQCLFNWFNLEPSRGRFCWEGADRKVAACAKAGVKLLGVLGYPPRWAAEPPPSGGIHDRLKYRRGMPGRWKPRELKEWGEYVYQTVAHFKGQVDYWEIYNEVDFHPPGMPASFSGSTQEYFELLREAYRQAKRANPDCKVLISGFSTVAVCDLKMPYELLQLGAADYCDIWNMHAYQGLVGVDRMMTEVHRVKKDMPFWMTEQMWHQVQDPVRQQYLTVAINFWFLEKGFAKFFTFGWNDVYADLSTQSPSPLFHINAVCQYFLRSGNAFTGTVKELSAYEFDIRHSIRRTDGQYLTVVGSSGGNYRLELKNRSVKAFSQWGKPVAVTGSAVATNGGILYLITPEPLQVVGYRQLSQQKLIANSGFEDLSGDNMGGSNAKCIPCGWSYRDNRYDPAGKIVVSPAARTGKNAIELTTSGKGQVYAFYEIKLTVPGKYRLSAWIKNVSGNAVPYFSTFDRISNKLEKHDFPVAGTGYAKYTWTVDFSKPPADILAVIIGVKGGPGSILVDDVEMTRIEEEKIKADRAVTVPLTHWPLQNPVKGSDKRTTDLSVLLKAGKGRRTVGGVPFEFTPAALAVSGGGQWQGVPPAVRLPVKPGLYRQLAVLVTALYVKAAPGTCLGRLRLLYEDGSDVVFPLNHQQQVRDWYLPGVPANTLPQPALTLTDAKFTDFGLFMPLLTNPKPDKTVTALELGTDADCLLVMTAVTLEKKS